MSALDMDNGLRLYLYCLAGSAWDWARESERVAAFDTLTRENLRGVDEHHPIHMLHAPGIVAVCSMVQASEFLEDNLQQLQWLAPRAMQSHVSRCAEEVQHGLAAHAVASNMLRCHGSALSGHAERMVFNISFLVDRQRLGGFRDEVWTRCEGMARTGLSLEMSGPWPDDTPAAKGPVPALRSLHPRRPVVSSGVQHGKNSEVRRILDKGIVIDAWVKVALVGIELLSIEARIVIVSVETYICYAEAIGLTSNVAAPA